MSEITGSEFVKIKGVGKLVDQIKLKVARDPDNPDLNETGSMYIAGKPGIGKTAIIGQLCEKENWGFVSTNGAAWDMGELRGMADVRGEETRFIKPEIFHQIEKLSKKHDAVVVFVDEAAKINTFSEGLFYELVNEKQVSPHEKLPDNVEFILASNTVEHGSLSDNELNPVLLNRGGFFEYEGPTLDEYLSHAAGTSVHHSVISFLRENEQCLGDYNADRNVNATPRSWSNFGKSLTKAENMGYRLSNEFIEQLGGQYVPQDIIKNFIAHRAFEDKVPTLSDIINDPEGVDIPNGISANYYLVYKMAQALNEDNAVAFDTISKRLDNSEIRAAFQKTVEISGKINLLKNVAKNESKEEQGNRVTDDLDDILKMTKRR